LQELNVSDRCFLALDHEIRKSGLRGNFLNAVFELDGLPDPAVLDRRIAAFVERFPIMRARLRKTRRGCEWVETGHSRPNFHFHPYSPSSGPRFEHDCPWNLVVQTHESADDVNPAEFHLIELEHGSLFVCHVYHPLIDGKGCERLIHTLFAEHEWDAMQKAERAAAPPCHAITSQFSNWEKLEGLWKTTRYFLRGKRSSLPPLNLCRAEVLGSRRLRYRADELTQILDTARARTTHSSESSKSRAKTGQFVFFVACSMRALHQAGVGMAGEGFNVAYMANLRRGRDQSPMFGNQVTFLWTGAPYDAVGNREVLVDMLASAHFQALESKMDRHVLAALDVGRYVPISVLGRLIRRGLGRRERHSFWFGYTGSFSQPIEQIEGVAVTGNYAVIPPTAPPSIVFTYTMYRGDLTVSITYIPAHFPDSWVERVAEYLDAELRSVLPRPRDAVD
jgi:hypothetical protein